VETKELSQSEYKELLDRLDRSEAPDAQKAWAQIMRYRKSSSPFSVAIFIFMVFGIAISSTATTANSIKNLLPCVIAWAGLYFVHWAGYRQLQRRKCEAEQIIRSLQLKYQR
jgi:lipopolysaccharide export LptBFGC system permease protein LptF